MRRKRKRYRHPSDDELRQIYRTTGTIAVVGASSDPGKPAHRIPAYLAQQGFRVLPVSPKGGELFGREVYPSLGEIEEPVDVVNVFRPSEEAPDIAQQAARIGAKVLWLQEGVFSQEAADMAYKAGMKVVMGVCMGTVHARLELEA
jgi:predicted CoA-binding protein